MSSKFKCQKCRRALFDGAFVLTNHSEPWTESARSACSARQTVWFLKDEVLETWLQAQIDAGGWVKGKIHCPHCSLRIGSYDFVSGAQCDCAEQRVLPPIHIVKSKVDHESPLILRNALQQQMQHGVVVEVDGGTSTSVESVGSPQQDKPSVTSGYSSTGVDQNVQTDTSNFTLVTSGIDHQQLSRGDVLPPLRDP